MLDILHHCRLFCDLQELFFADSQLGQFCRKPHFLMETVYLMKMLHIFICQKQNQHPKGDNLSMKAPLCLMERSESVIDCMGKAGIIINYMVRTQQNGSHPSAYNDRENRLFKFPAGTAGRRASANAFCPYWIIG